MTHIHTRTHTHTYFNFYGLQQKVSLVVKEMEQKVVKAWNRALPVSKTSVKRVYIHVWAWHDMYMYTGLQTYTILCSPFNHVLAG